MTAFEMNNIFQQYTSISDNVLSKKKRVAAKPLLPSTTSFLQIWEYIEIKRKNLDQSSKSH